MDNAEIHRRDFMKYTGIGLTGMALPGLAMGCRKAGIPLAESKTFNASIKTE